MGISRSLSHPNGWSIVSFLVVLATVISSWIRVESFSTIQQSTRGSFSTLVCEPLRASFLNEEENPKKDLEILNELREGQLSEALLVDQFLSTSVGSDGDSPSSSFVSLSLVGQSRLPLAERATESEQQEPKKKTQQSFATVLVVAPDNNSGTRSLDNGRKEPLPVMFLPLTPPIDSRLRLLIQAYTSKPISSFSNLIPWNLNLINRDDSLFDNIPWNQWSKDPDRKNRDPAGNLVDAKFRYGKRDAYNRFTGKDVNAKTVAESKRRYWQQKLVSSLEDTSDDGQDSQSDDPDSTFSQACLSKRVLELRIQELRMEIAELDSELAISRTSNRSNSADLEEARADLVKNLQQAETNLNDLLSSLSEPSSSPKSESNVLDKIARWAVDISMNYRTEQNEAPYRGATGYAPRLSDVEDDADVEFYRSPFDLLNEILSDQLNAEVIECVLENTSWLDGTIALGGAVVLQRRTPTIEKTIMGERLRTPDRDEDFGNIIKGGEIFVVECDVDEAVGVALSRGLPIKVEKTIFERSSMMGVEEETGDSENTRVTNIKQKLPYWRVLDSGVSMDVEGDPGDPETSRLSPISIPRTTSSLFDSIFEPSTQNSGDSASSSSMFPTDNPIKSISQLDSLGNKGKAKTLLEISNFSGKLPRPRTVRKAPADENPLDKLLLPLIDESVRKEYNIREAERRGDKSLVEELRAKKSNRQTAKEQVEAARREGNDDLAAQWENEAEFLESLRADVTQDEGSYSRFLDKDDWYERDRQRNANRVKRSSFGNLLDGIE